MPLICQGLAVDVRPSFRHLRTSITRDPIHCQGSFFFIETVCIISSVHKIGSPPCFHQKFLENNRQTLGDGRHPVADSIYLVLIPGLFRISGEYHLSYIVQMATQLPAGTNLSEAQEERDLNLV